MFVQGGVACDSGCGQLFNVYKGFELEETFGPMHKANAAYGDCEAC